MIHEAFVCGQSHRTNDRMLINVVEENNRHLNITYTKMYNVNALALRIELRGPLKSPCSQILYPLKLLFDHQNDI